MGRRRFQAARRAVNGDAAACGIDFGTSNSTVALVRGGQGGLPSLLPLEDGRPTLPSVVFFHAEDGHVSYGRAALDDYLAGHEGRLMRSLKSLLGTAMMEESTEVAGRALSFRALLEQFMAELKRRAEVCAGQPLRRAVLGRPVFFVDGDAEADRRAEETLAGIARSVGLADIAFQYEPIAAAFDHEARISREALVLVVDIGGGTSDFALVRLSPDRRLKPERRDDILASSGVHIGGTDFDKYLSLAAVMPMLGFGTLLKSGLEVPSAPFFNLATSHTINQAYSRKAAAQIAGLQRDAVDGLKLGRLNNLVQERAGHWLAMQVEAAKIALSDSDVATLDLGRIAPGESLEMHRATFDAAIDGLLSSIVRTVRTLLRDAGVTAGAVDTVFFTGGSSGVPLLRAGVAALLPQAQHVEGDRFGSIGAGLALDAVRRFG
ncbi:MAG: Hsp70 family protein [Polaromonas sp.]|nr:Hsp70 family protein [Polaromonas sp.]